MNSYPSKSPLYNKILGIISFIVLFVGIAVTFFIWQYTRDNVRNNAESNFTREVNQIEYALTKRIGMYKNILFALQGLFSASESVERQEWSPFVRTARIVDYPDIEYISYIEIVKDDEKEEFIKSFRSDIRTSPAGYPNFAIYPEGKRSEYAVVKYIYPENEESLNALGFDLYSSPPRKIALDKARDMNQPVASELINLATDGSSGFFMAAPIYENGKPINTAEEKIAALKGFVIVTFKISSLFTNIFPTDSPPEVVFTIYDQDDVLYKGGNVEDVKSSIQQNRYTETRMLEVGQRTWLLEVVSKPSFANSFSERGVPTIAAIGGIVLSLMLFLIIYYSGKSVSHLILLQSTALKAAANSVVITDIKGIIQWVNPAFTKLTGYEPNELVGKSTRILNSGKQGKEFYRNLWNTILAGKTWKGEITNKRKDGTLYQEEQYISPVTDKSGKVTNFIAIKQDITQRKQIEEKITLTNRELEDSKKAMVNMLEDLNSEKTNLAREKVKDEAILANIGDGLIGTDDAGKITLINHSAEVLLGLSAKKVIGKKFIDTIPMFDESKAPISPDKRALTKALTHGIPTHDSNKYYQHADRTKFPIVATVTPVILNKKIMGTIEVFRDITKEKEIDQLKDEFVSITSHELRTPLTAIDGLVSMILDGEYGAVNDNLKQPLKDVNESSDRLIRLVNNLLNVSRMRVGKEKYILSEFLLSKKLKQTIELLDVVADKKKISLKLAEIPDVQIQADEDKFQEVLNNIIGNSIKFTDKGGITIKAQVKDDHVEISVTDSGLGIAKEDQSKLFGKFEQISTKTDKPAGTGLGLYISRAMACKMGGDVWLAQSIPEKGSTFIFSVPIAKSKIAQRTKKEIENESKANPDHKSN